MSERMTRERAWDRLSGALTPRAQDQWAKQAVDLLLAVQSEAEARVVAQCCEEVLALTRTVPVADLVPAKLIIERIRAAFPLLD